MNKIAPTGILQIRHRLTWRLLRGDDGMTQYSAPMTRHRQGKDCFWDEPIRLTSRTESFPLFIPPATDPSLESPVQTKQNIFLYIVHFLAKFTVFLTLVTSSVTPEQPQTW
jgi:hypothetical protein